MIPQFQQDFSKDVRTRVYEALQRYNIKQIEVSRESGINHSTLSLWLQGKIKGHYIRAEETLEEWLQNLYSNKPRFIKNSIVQQGGYPGSRINSGPNQANSIIPRPISNLDTFQKNFSNYTNKDLANKDCQLIPIRFDIEYEGKKYKEILNWNLNEPYLTPDSFAKLLAEENNLPTMIEHEIAFTIKRQISNYKKYEQKQKENIRVIHIDMRINNIQLKDRFEWDVNDTTSDPDEFAYNCCAELGLDTDFAVEYAHQIREQILQHQKVIMDQKSLNMASDDFTLKKSTRNLLESNQGYSNIEINNMNNKQITVDNYLRPLNNPNNEFNDNLSYWEPQLEILNDTDIKKLQNQEDRKIRYTARRLR